MTRVVLVDSSLLWQSKYKAKIQSAIDDCVRYWMSNVQKHFSRSDTYGIIASRGHLRKAKFASSPGHLQNSLSYNWRGDKIAFHMEPIYNIAGQEYGHFLREGTPPSPGKYSSTLGVRLKHGIREGTSNQDWEIWEMEFSTYVDERFGVLLKEIAELVRFDTVKRVQEQIRRGVVM